MSARNAVVDANVTSDTQDNTGGSPLANAIGTTLPSSISQTGTIRSDDTVSSSGVVSGGTKANAVYYFRSPKQDVVLDANSVTGTTLTVVPVDISIDTQVTNLGLEYQKYRFKDLTVSLVNNSPFGTTSGSIVVGHIPDPSNKLPTDTTKALMLATRLSGSRVVTPRNSVEIKPALSTDWKWCKPAGTPRLESFGTLFVLVRQPCSKDSIAQWNVTISGTVQFAESTVNSNTVVTKSRLGPTAVDFTQATLYRFDGNPQFFLSFRINGINNEGILVSDTLLLADYVITDSVTDEKLNMNITQMDVVNVKGVFYAVAQTVISDVTSLDLDKLTLKSLTNTAPSNYSLYVSSEPPRAVPSAFFSFSVDPTLPTSEHLPRKYRPRKVY
ncbi:putative structural protein [Beihai hepe-like virus 8]|uniref:putative structural protein n=1 Tax=Beihai hepe-like virus 8 TaxID=1922385 RepID=UPI0009099846|nr:putative structural protein [Beihai hepe-like virus 8]APG77602.1 putative structural protein [Beihai hepe-like virus 8]